MAEIVRGSKDEKFCRGCLEIHERLFAQQNHAMHDRDGYRTPLVAPRNRLLGPLVIHTNFRELDMCAEACEPCRIFRHALLLTQHTSQAPVGLDASSYQIYAALDREVLIISVGDSESCFARAQVSYSREILPRRLRQPSLAYDRPPVFGQAREWLHNCRKGHALCSKLRWSNRMPTWLIQIFSDGLLRLVAGDQLEHLPYVALSYSWGNTKEMSDDDKATVMANKTTGSNKRHRQQLFSALELSKTLRDAIEITKNLGVEYLWVDSVCIPQGSNWNDEASRMHEVYGNAAVTLVAGSIKDATNGMLSSRAAWKFPRTPGTLAGYSLAAVPTSLDVMRVQIPVSHRAWTLQEERLSPRLLYWCGQMLYWSCSEVRQHELGVLGGKFGTSQSQAQNFMNIRRRGELGKLLEEWLDIVEDFVHRDLAYPEDRFAAISGLAVLYYSAHVSNIQGAKPNEEYLAGLWRGSFARHLAWSVETAADPSCQLRSFQTTGTDPETKAKTIITAIIPSWTWASLPRCTATRTKEDFSPVEAFQLQESMMCPDPESAMDAVKRGAAVKEVTVRGKLRRLINPGSHKREWTSILWNGHDGAFLFDDPSIPVHSRNLRDGRLLVYEAHFQELVAQLDYNLPANDGDEDSQRIHVPDGDETYLFVLEIGVSVMVLLEKVEANPPTYRRCGLCRGYRQGFFNGIEPQQVRLI